MLSGSLNMLNIGFNTIDDRSSTIISLSAWHFQASSGATKYIIASDTSLKKAEIIIFLIINIYKLHSAQKKDKV